MATENSSPEFFDLAKEVGATPPERVILSTLGIATNGVGALASLRTALRAMAAAVRHHEAPRATAWLEVARQLTIRVAAASKVRVWLEVQGATLKGKSVSYALGNPVHSRLPKEAQQRLDVWLGFHIYAAIGHACPLATQVVSDWETLLRSDRPRLNRTAAWHDVARDMPLDAAQLRAAITGVDHPRLVDALRRTLAALATELPDPAAPVSTDTGRVDDGEAVGSSSLPQDVQNGAPNEPEDEGDDDEPGDDGRHCLLGWIQRSATFAGYRHRFGIPGLYGELPPEELRRTCRALAAALADGHPEDRCHATLAEVSLKTSLPPRLALSIPVACNGDLWLEAVAGVVAWNYRLAVGLPGIEAVRVRLSTRTQRHLTELQDANPGAATLQELLRIGAGEEAARLKAYAAFLRQLGDGPYKAYVARFSSSYHGVFHARGHGAAFAALLSLDFRALPPGMLHYINLPESRLAEVQRDVDRYLGFAWPHDVQLAEAA